MTIEELAKAIDEKVGGRTLLEATVKFDCADDGCVFVDGHTGSVSMDNKEADCTISLDKDVLEDLLNGEQNAAAAFMMGKIKLDGDAGIAMQLGELFN
ncbi:MAG: SCP2 sterol-binding domain-containing protein [Nitratireductor sp.]